MDTKEITFLEFMKWLRNNADGFESKLSKTTAENTKKTWFDLFRYYLNGVENK